MSDLLFSFQCVFPLFVMIFLGYLLRRLKVISDSFVSVGTKIVFKLTLPILLFLEISQADLTTVFNGRLILFCLVTTAVLMVLLCLIVPRFVKDKADQSVMIQGMFRGNYAIIGVPLAINMFGEKGALPATLILPFMVPFYNVAAVILLTILDPTNDDGAKKIPLKKILLGVVTNPLVIGIVLGLPFSLLHWKLPSLALDCLQPLANMTTPLALLCLGGQFTFSDAKSNLRLSMTATVFKLVIIPIVMLALAVAMGFRNEELGAIFVLYTAPTAVASYVMAKNMHANDTLAGQILILTTSLSCVTIFLLLFAIKSMGFIA